jgi:hypothetical protein
MCCGAWRCLAQLMHGAKVSELELARLFRAPVSSGGGGSSDRYHIFAEIRANARNPERMRVATRECWRMLSSARDGPRRAKGLPPATAPVEVHQEPDSPRVPSRSGSDRSKGSSMLVENSTSASKNGRRQPSGRFSTSMLEGMPEVSPWRPEQVFELNKYIVGFERYAKKQIVVNAFDLMCWGICCGAPEFVRRTRHAHRTTCTCAAPPLAPSLAPAAACAAWCCCQHMTSLRTCA